MLNLAENNNYTMDKEEALKADLINKLKSIGKMDAAKTVKEKGLPSHIYASKDICQVCKKLLSKYAKVIENPYYDDKLNILFAWHNNTSLINT